MARVLQDKPRKLATLEIKTCCEINVQGEKQKVMATALLIGKFQKLFFNKEKSANHIDRFVFGQKLDLITKLFGCWHENISRPFVQGKTAYRSCLGCGARKQFNTETLETYGNFYFPPIAAEESR